MYVRPLKPEEQGLHSAAESPQASALKAKPSFKAAIFDLDGTLIDSNPFWEKINRRMLEKRGLKYCDALIKEITLMSYDEAARAMRSCGAPDSEEELIAQMNAQAVYEYENNIPLKSNVKEYLELLRARNIKIALATMSSGELYEPVLKNNGVYHLFDAFCSAHDNQAIRGKDFPDIYITAASLLGVAPEECVVFEDILKGIISAKSIGMKTIAVYDKYSEASLDAMRLEAEQFICDFSEIFGG
ncbi:MAG: HAD family phosphatase [Oscillospiraceae bacterium]|nr:HAD family phosphatase [Oscillospiraceae bacterium]